jgi:hypothetical protein
MLSCPATSTCTLHSCLLLAVLIPESLNVLYFLSTSLSHVGNCLI